jgi:CubicO group peptidase (beta-lactamase class C family)
MRRTAAAAFILFTFAAVALAREPGPLPMAAPEEVGLSTDRLAKIDAVLKSEVDAGRIPGAVIMVARKGRLVYHRAFGFQDKEAGKPMGEDAMFRLYSMTKPFVSVAAMMLVEDGKLQLADSVSKYLPAMKGMQVSVAKADGQFARLTYSLVPAEREMTVHDLLRHTSGLAYGEITLNAPVRDAYAKAGVYLPGTRDYDARNLTPAEEVEALAKAPLAQQPGTVWEYSLSVDVLGRVVEAASGERLGDFLAARLFKPIGMDESGFFVPPERIARLAQALPVDPTSGQPNRLIDVSALPNNDSGGAGGVGTAADYLRFGQMLLNGGQLDGTRILSRTTVALMASDHLGAISPGAGPGQLLLGTPGYTFGLGFMVRQGQGVAGVPGSPGEFMWAGYAGTFFWVDPKEELVAIVMAQTPGPVRAYYRRLVKQLVYQAIVDDPAPADRATPQRRSELRAQ